ncbi:hypothetical protein [Streptomyces sp. JV184]|uniref:hypothetical protein n=1 Tax=Streptomyces sp. JV184 TaxID=858637 RepID=UPI002E79E6A1|nr:hypothetical protein [Streptomyces sp. JV184]MEE1744100.1 hypothetical protein [Streptomyces sp. JV184]
MTTALSDHCQLFDLPSLPERLITLADDFIVHGDLLKALAATGHLQGSALRQQIPTTQELVVLTLGVRESIDGTLRSTPAVVDASLRLRQTAYLAAGAAEELRGLLILNDAGHSVAAHQAGMAKDLTALGAETCVALAETIAVETLRQRVAQTRESAPVLSSADLPAMHAVARGKAHVTLMLGRQYISNDDGARLSINTIRGLETRALIQREDADQEGKPQRLRLTAAGVSALASAFGQAPSTTPGHQSSPSPVHAPAPMKRSR